jgi:hypothetical protein
MQEGTVSAMKVLVVYESMYGNTHEVAEAIGEGFDTGAEVTLMPVSAEAAEMVTDTDLLVVGGPTHVHGMSRKRTRAAAMETAAKDPDVEADPAAPGPGLRAWLKDLRVKPSLPAAAFDTRTKGPQFLTGSAAKGIASRLERVGCAVIVEPEGFVLEDGNGPLLPGELDRAQEWAGEILHQAKVLNVVGA